MAFSLTLNQAYPGLTTFSTPTLLDNESKEHDYQYDGEKEDSDNDTYGSHAGHNQAR